MVQLFNKFNPISVVTLYLLNWVLKLSYVLRPTILPTLFNKIETGLIHFPFLQNWVLQYPSLYIVFSIHICFLMALVINFVLQKHKLVSKNNLLPAFSFVILSSMLMTAFLFSVYTIIAFLLIWSISKLFDITNNGKNTRIGLMESGLIFGLILLMSPIYAIFILFFCISILILKSINIKNILAFLFGSLFPFLFLITIYWILDPRLINKIHSTSIVLPKTFIYTNHYLQIFVSIIMALLIAQFNITGTQIKQPIQITNKWQVLRLSSIIILICTHCTSIFPSCAIYSLTMILSILIYPCFNMVLHPKIANFTALLFIVATFINEYILK